MTTLLTDHDVEILTPRPRHERAAMLLTGRCGPLVGAPYEHDVAAVAYVAYLAWIRARVPGNMLGGKPGYEAAETLGHRVRIAGQCSGSLGDFGHDLFRRLGLSIAALTAEDAIWWRLAQVTHGAHWSRLQERQTLTEAVVAVGLLDELLRSLPKHTTQETP